MEAKFHGVSSHIGSIKTAWSGVSDNSEEASACWTALNMSFGSYSGLVMQELVRRKIKEFITATNISSSGKVEQYVTPSITEQLRGLPKFSVVVSNVSSIA